MRKITKAVIPVAGLGTRMLPATKEIPKELLPILDKPIIQYIVVEAVNAGISEIIFVTNASKETIKNHFKQNLTLEKYLKEKKKKDTLSKFPNYLFKKINFSSVLQKAPLGLGHAILAAEKKIKNENFAVFLPDEFLVSKTDKSDFNRMLDNYSKTSKNQILVEKVPKKIISNYGVVKLKSNKISVTKPENILDIIEKPLYRDAPSDKRVVGRYILPNIIFKFLKKTKPGADNEIQLTDALRKMILQNSDSFQATLSESKIFDCGSMKGFVGANIAMGLKDKDLKKHIMETLI